MLLAIPPTYPPMPSDHKPLYEYSSYKSSHPRYSPPESPRNFPPFSHERRMSNPHRGLPLPAGLSLPPPDRGPSSAPSLGHLPAPPSQWTGQDESMRSWLHAKAEEDRRKQEEEKTKQEGLRLDQRRVEQTMLRESLQGGVPPAMVPLIFAGLSGGNVSNQVLDWAQQYITSLNLQSQPPPPTQPALLGPQQPQLPPPPPPPPTQQQQLPAHQSMSPDAHRDRMIPPNPYATHQPVQNPHHQGLPPLSGSTGATGSIGRQMGNAPAPSPSMGSLSRLNTVDYIPSPAGQPHSARPSIQSSQPSAAAQSDQGTGPGLFFHHWTPPNTGNGNPPSTPSGKSAHTSPFSQNAQSHLRSEHQSSPKKRKAVGGHPPPPAPTSQPSDLTAPFSSRSSRDREISPGQIKSARPRRHSRAHSDASSHDLDQRHIPRPSSRQQRAEELGGGLGNGPKRQLTGSSTSGSSEDHIHRYEGVKYETR